MNVNINVLIRYLLTSLILMYTWVVINWNLGYSKFRLVFDLVNLDGKNCKFVTL